MTCNQDVLLNLRIAANFCTRYFDVDAVCHVPNIYFSNILYRTLFKLSVSCLTSLTFAYIDFVFTHQ